MISCYHGLIGNARNWEPLLDALGTKDDFSKSDIDYVRNGIEKIIEAERQKLFEYKVAKKITLGNSLGCLVALGVGDDVQKIILTAPPYSFGGGFIPRTRSGIEKYIRGIYCDRPLNDEQKLELDKTGRKFSRILSDRKNIPKLRQLAKSVQEFSYWELVKKHRKKVHIVLGAEDTLTPQSEILPYLEENLPDVTVEILKGCGHAVPLEKPRELANIIERYS